jgi:hypothetical protein
MRQIATLTIAAAFVALGLAVAPPPAAAFEPCCGIQSVDTRTGIVTAIDRATGQSFQFQVTNPAQLQGLRPGQPVYGNAASGRVGLTQGAPCCNVVGRGAATGAAAPIGPVDGARAAAPVGPVDGARAAAPVGPVDGGRSAAPVGPVDARTAPHTSGGRR